MTGLEAMERVLQALRSRLKGHWGRIARIEAQIGKSRGYLSRTLQRSWPLPLDVLLRTLDALGVDPGDFFGQALDIAASPEANLTEIEAESRASPRVALVAFERLAAGPAAAAGVPAPCSCDEAAAWVRDLSRLSPAEQKRRLRSRRKLRRARFVATYLDHLDGLRYERPQEARSLTEHLILELVPLLPAGAPSEAESRRALQCRALGVLGSCHRLAGDIAFAAGTIRRGLAEARRHGLQEATAELLQRGAYVLSDRGRYRRALELLREAFEIYFDRELGFGVARTLVDRGIMMGYAGADGEAVALLGRAHRELPEEAASVTSQRRGALERNREAVYHHLVMAHTALGELATAERWLREATRRLGSQRHVEARLAWQRGRLLLARGASLSAERELREALDTFDEDRDPSSELVRLDLLQVLLSTGRHREARRLADEQASLARVRRRAAVDTAFSRLARAGREGRLTLRLVRSAADACQKRRRPAAFRSQLDDAPR